MLSCLKSTVEYNRPLETELALVTIDIPNKDGQNLFITVFRSDEPFPLSPTVKASI